MKKGFAITLLLLCAMVSHAWLVPSGSPSESEDFMMSATVDEMKCAIDVQGCSFVADLTAVPTTSVFLPMRMWIRSGTSRHDMTVVKNKGIKGLMVGSYGSNNGGFESVPVVSMEGSDISPVFRSIYSIELSYYKLDPNERTPMVDPQLASFKELSATWENGIYTYKGIIEPYFPVTHVALGTDFAGMSHNTNNILTQIYDPMKENEAWASGYVITSIKVRCGFGAGAFVDARRELGAKEALGQILLSANTTASQQFKQLGSADLNGDGMVNATDVVTLYNIIIGGKPNAIQGHEYVDLGLPSGTLWATCNVGSLVSEGYGDYLSWLESRTSLLKGKSQFLSDTYSPSYSVNNLSENQTVVNRYFATGAGTLNIYSDWSQWEVPTKADWEELLQYASISIIKQHGVEGYLFTSPKNKNSIFIPSAGYFDAEGYHQSSEDRMRLNYWSSTFSYLNSSGMPLVHILGVDIEPCLMQLPAYDGAPMRMVHRALQK